MKEPRHDDERLAELLEGRLEGPERDELLAYLASADEDLQVFARTAAVLHEMETDDAPQVQAQDAGEQVDHVPARKAVPPSVEKGARGWPGRRAPRWAAIPAVLAGLVALVLVVQPGRGSAGDPLRMAQRLEQTQASRAPDLWPEVEWEGTVRGEGSPVAVQAGAFLLRLAVAIRAHDTAATAELALFIKARFDDQGGSALDQIAARAGAPPGELESLLKQATDRLEKQLDREDLRLGAWLEAARLAAVTQNQAFFRSGETRTMLRHAERLAGDNSTAQDAVSGIRTQLSAEGNRDWTALNTGLTTLLEEIGTERG